mgnify:CR=1 FL=1
MHQASDVEAQLAVHGERLLRWLRDDALPLWWAVGADHAGGGFHEAIDLAGQPVRAERRARVQARQIFTYAVAGELGCIEVAMGIYPARHVPIMPDRRPAAMPPRMPEEYAGLRQT